MITRFFCCWMFWLIIDSPDIQIIKFLRGFVLELRVKDCQSNVINNIKFITYMLTWLKSEMWSVCYLYEFALFGILYLSTRRHKKLLHWRILIYSWVTENEVYARAPTYKYLPHKPVSIEQNCTVNINIKLKWNIGRLNRFQSIDKYVGILAISIVKCDF